MEREFPIADNFPAGQGFVRKVRAEEQVAHVWFGRGGLGHAKGRTAKFASGEVIF